MFVIEHPLPAAPAADSNVQVLSEWNALYDAYNEELKSMFEKQAGVERFDLIQSFHACKQEEGSGYQQKDRKPSQNDKTEHGMEKTVQNQGQSPKMPKSESILKNTIECNLYPSDGPGKPNMWVNGELFLGNYDRNGEIKLRSIPTPAAPPVVFILRATVKIEAMQEELHEFERLEVWELVPPPDKAFVITLKWIYKVKLDELGALQAQEDLMKSIESFLKKFNRISFGKTPKVLLQAWDNFIEAKHAQPEEVQELLSKLVQDVKIISDELSEYINTPAWNRPLVYCDDDDDEDYTIAITPVLSTEEPVNSLIMEDEHLDTIPATESDEFIKSSVEILVPIPSESKGVPKVCDVPFHDNSPPLDISKDQSEDFSDSNVDSTSTDEDSFSSNDVEYVEASPPNSEPVSSKVMEIVIPEVGRIEDDILLIKDDTLREKLLNVNRLVAKIEALKDNPVPSSVVVTKSTSTFPNLFLEETNTFDNSLPESETFCFNLEEPSSGSPTTLPVFQF
ncbi:hypothetical protein Tco_0956250 [Tanacetum coccineum]|uniref:Uncharacterized protein n=1 Tax=Tanacetum coccineum TaxID=301880 RepID=A0ABQ5E9F8_9ASTR